jgi:hypothetical protein
MSSNYTTLLAYRIQLKVVMFLLRVYIYEISTSLIRPYGHCNINRQICLGLHTYLGAVNCLILN